MQQPDGKICLRVCYLIAGIPHMFEVSYRKYRNIPALLAFGRSNCRLYLISQFVDGENRKEILPRSRQIYPQLYYVFKFGGFELYSLPTVADIRIFSIAEIGHINFFRYEHFALGIHALEIARASSKVARVLRPMLRAMPGSRAPTM